MRRARERESVLSGRFSQQHGLEPFKWEEVRSSGAKSVPFVCLVSNYVSVGVIALCFHARSSHSRNHSPRTRALLLRSVHLCFVVPPPLALARRLFLLHFEAARPYWFRGEIKTAAATETRRHGCVDGSSGPSLHLLPAHPRAARGTLCCCLRIRSGLAEVQRAEKKTSIESETSISSIILA